MVTEHDFFCLRQLIRGDATLFHFVDNVQRHLLGCFAFLWIDGRVDAEQTGIARCVGKCRNAKRETSLLANAPVQPRTTALTKNH
jgi:hypothetical protein